MLINDGQSQQEEEGINIPGFDNTFEPSAGSDGLRINIHEPGAVPNPSFQVRAIPLCG